MFYIMFISTRMSEDTVRLYLRTLTQLGLAVVYMGHLWDLIHVEIHNVGWIA